MSVHAVVTGVEAASNEPFPKRRVRCVQGLGPVAVPVEQVGVLPEALGEMFLAEALTDLWVGRISLGDEACRWVVVLLLPPMDGNLCLADRGAGVLRCCHGQPPCGEELMSTLHRSPAMGTRSLPSHGRRAATCLASPREVSPCAGRAARGTRCHLASWRHGCCQLAARRPLGLGSYLSGAGCPFRARPRRCPSWHAAPAPLEAPAPCGPERLPGARRAPVGTWFGVSGRGSGSQEVVRRRALACPAGFWLVGCGCGASGSDGSKSWYPLGVAVR